ncbi:MAG: ABC transporter transmembrane domain-containing protein, partial [Elusimicrobia bacterium]|nr:ABC transporter transmembrane domain-containing protein [Elusimicrobiota bacterium]
MAKRCLAVWTIAAIISLSPGVGTYEALARTLAAAGIAPSRGATPVSLAAGLKTIGGPPALAPAAGLRAPGIRAQAGLEVPAVAAAPGSREFGPARLEVLAAQLRQSEPEARLAGVFDGSVPRGSEAADPAASIMEPGSGPALSRRWPAVLRGMCSGDPIVAPFVRPYRARMNLARGLLIFKSAASMAVSYSVGALVDAAIAQALPAVGLWLGAAVGFTVLKGLSRRFYSVVSGKLRIDVRRDVRVSVFEGLTRMSDPGEDAGRLAARLTSDVNRVVVKNVTVPILLPHLAIQFVLAAGFVLQASPLMAAVMLGSLPLLGWLAWRYGRRCAALQELASTESAAMTDTGAEILARSPLPDDQRGPAVARYKGASDRFERTMLEYIGVGANFDSLREVLQAASTELLILGVGLLSFVLTGAPSVGRVM